MKASPWILGISVSHNGAACLLKGDKIVVAVQEERLSRRKRDVVQGFDARAIAYCLNYAQISPKQLEMVCMCSVSPQNESGLRSYVQEHLKVPFHFVPHHLGHAVSAFALSGHKRAAILVVDGMGSPVCDLQDDEKRLVVAADCNVAETISVYIGDGASIYPLEKHCVPSGKWLSFRDEGMPRFRSFGGMFSACAFQCFGNAMEAGKVMGLAAYGQRRFPTESFYRFKDGTFSFLDTVPEQINVTGRWPLHQAVYADLAASAQGALEDGLIYLVDRAKQLSSAKHLCYVGGVALNTVANEMIIRSEKFTSLFIPPAAEDSGTAIGAAYSGLWRLSGRNERIKLGEDSLGRVYTAADVASAVQAVPGVHPIRTCDIVGFTVESLISGKIVAWFQGRSELGPRALGYRSILCDARPEWMKTVLNGKVKFRESFRPFGATILAECAKAWLDLDTVIDESPYMLRVARVRPELAHTVPAVVHVDGTVRFQTVRRESNTLLHRLIEAFAEQTGVPLLLNTSLNTMGEPISETPEDGLRCFVNVGIDLCVIGDQVFGKH
jgi:carbamoyltransferase